MKTQTVVVLVTLLVACVRIQTGRNNFVGGRDVAIITIWGGSYYLLHHHTTCIPVLCSFALEPNQANVNEISCSYMCRYYIALHLSQTRLTLTR